MKKTIRNALIATITLVLLLSVALTVNAEDPDYVMISLDPTEPVRQTEVEFSVEVTGDNIEEVYIRVQECYDTESGEACSPNVLNISMTQTGNTTWVGTATLNWDKTTIGHCWLEIKSNGTWFDFKNDKTKWTDFNVLEAENGENGENGGNGGNGSNGDDKNTPGFELILLVISIIVALSIYKKKRIR